MQQPNTLWDNPAPFTKILSPAEKDIDGLNHTNNAVYVQWCEEAAWAHSTSLGMDLDAYKQLNRAMAIRHADYDYLLPSNLGDQLVIGTWLTDSDGKISLERRFQIVRPSDGATILRGRWNLVCIEMGSGRPRRMPPEFCDAYLGALISTSTSNTVDLNSAHEKAPETSRASM